MKNFIKDYPEFKKLGNTVSRHVAVMSELSRLIEANCLMEVSEFEQELACSADHSKAVKVSDAIARFGFANSVSVCRVCRESKNSF